MNGLVLHCGGAAVERGQLVQVQTPPSTATWHPIPHHWLLEGVQTTLEGAGFRITEEAHALSRNGARYFGLLQLANNDSNDNGGDFAMVLGLRNSHDKSFPAGGCLGGKVFVCDNLSFHSEITFARKHTTFIQRDLPALIARGVSRLMDSRHEQEQRFATYKSKELAEIQVHDLAIRALKCQAINMSHIPHLIQEWETPSHPEFATCGKTAWRFYNAATEVLKGALTLLPQRTQALHGLLDATCGLHLTKS